MKVVDIRSKTVDELKDQLRELKRESLNLSFQRESGQLESTSRIRAVRHDIARIRTVLNEKRRAS